MDTQAEEQYNNDDQPLIPEETKQASKALALLLLYSFMMFTFPFGTFFATKYILQDVFNVNGFTNTAWSVLLSVVTVNLIIVGYVYHAYHEKDLKESVQDGSEQKADKQD